MFIIKCAQPQLRGKGRGKQEEEEEEEKGEGQLSPSMPVGPNTMRALKTYSPFIHDLFKGS